MSSLKELQEQLFKSIRKDKEAKVMSIIEQAKNDYGTIEELVNAKDEKGNTALHYAITTDREDIVKILIKHGADPELKSRKWSPLDIAMIGYPFECNEGIIKEVIIGLTNKHGENSEKLHKALKPWVRDVCDMTDRNAIRRKLTLFLEIYPKGNMGLTRETLREVFAQSRSVINDSLRDKNKVEEYLDRFLSGKEEDKEFCKGVYRDIETHPNSWELIIEEHIGKSKSIYELFSQLLKTSDNPSISVNAGQFPISQQEAAQKQAKPNTDFTGLIDPQQVKDASQQVLG